MNVKSPRIFGILLSILGFSFIIGGIRLFYLGDNLYFVFLGQGIFLSGILITFGKIAGAYIYGFTYIVAVCWAVIDEGLNPGPLLVRLALLTIIGIYVCSSKVKPRLTNNRITSGGNDWGNSVLILFTLTTIALASFGVIRSWEEEKHVDELIEHYLEGSLWVLTSGSSLHAEPDGIKFSEIVFRDSYKVDLRNRGKFHRRCYYEPEIGKIVLMCNIKGSLGEIELRFSNNGKMLRTLSGVEYTRQ